MPGLFRARARARERERERERERNTFCGDRRRCDDTLLHRRDIYAARDTPRELQPKINRPVDGGDLIKMTIASRDSFALLAAARSRQRIAG